MSQPVSAASAELIEAAEENKQFVALDDGFYYFLPKANVGVYSSWMLHALADECDRRNKSWQEDINLYFNKENEMTFGQEIIADTGISLALDELSDLISRLSDQITQLEEKNDKLQTELADLRELAFS